MSLFLSQIQQLFVTVSILIGFFSQDSFQRGRHKIIRIE